jgi:ParB-like chromosome segregation protein Spo0J
MTQAKLVLVSIASIDPNPMRRLKKYPYNEARVDNLQDSIASVGFFEGVHARKAGSRYQLAFGHHRTEACRRNGIKKIPLLVKQYTNREMLKLLSRENDDVGEGRMEVFLEVWDGAVIEYAKELKEVSAAERTGFLARELGGGWVAAQSVRADTDRPSARAQACAKIEHHGLDHKAFVGVASRTSRDMINRAESLEKKVDRAEERGDIAPATADKLRDTTWNTMADVVAQDADPASNPGRKLGYRAAIAEFDEATEKIAEKVKPFAPELRESMQEDLDEWKPQ